MGTVSSRVAIVTGGQRGIGRAIALRLAQDAVETIRAAGGAVASRRDVGMVRTLANCARFMRSTLFVFAWLGASIAHATTGGGHRAPPFVGQRFDLTFSNGFRVVDEFVTLDELRFTVRSPPSPGRSGTVHYRWSVIAPHIYAIRWTEADGGIVMHIDDFNKNISRSYYVPAGGTLVESCAPMRRIR